MVAALAKTVERVNADASAGTTSPPGRRAWDVDGAELVDWVGQLAERYELAVVLPACWPRHGAIVEALAALYVGWQSLGAQGGLTRAQWHDYFDRALTRFEGRWRTCIDGTHWEPVLADWLETGPRRCRGHRPDAGPFHPDLTHAARAGRTVSGSWPRPPGSCGLERFRGGAGRWRLTGRSGDSSCSVRRPSHGRHRRPRRPRRFPGRSPSGCLGSGERAWRPIGG